MSVIDQLKDKKQKVEHLLKTKPLTRDDDNLLLATYWYFEIRESIENLSAVEFLRLLTEGRLTGSETIRRVRQKLQEQNPTLRGKSYKARKKEETEVRNEIGKL